MTITLNHTIVPARDHFLYSGAANVELAPCSAPSAD